MLKVCHAVQKLQCTLEKYRRIILLQPFAHEKGRKAQTLIRRLFAFFVHAGPFMAFDKDPEGEGEYW